LARKILSLRISFEYIEGVAKDFCGKGRGIVPSKTLSIRRPRTERSSHFLTNVRFYVLKAIHALGVVGRFVENCLANVEFDAVAEVVRYVSFHHSINLLRRKVEKVGVRLGKHKIRQCTRYRVASCLGILTAVSWLKRVGYAVGDFPRRTPD
jgi:hypothetical protein